MIRLSIDHIQARLLKLSFIFIAFTAAAISLAPAVRSRTDNLSIANLTSLPWLHWIGLLVWVIVISYLHRQTAKYLPDRDPYLLPIAGLLSGWGMLMIFRLSTELGLRQTAWLAVAGVFVTFGIRNFPDLSILRRYKYLWLSGGIALTGLTLIFGTNPLGYGPRLWLGCCGIYLQPSEPLKLLLVVYLAAFLADRQIFLFDSAATNKGGFYKISAAWFPILAPTILMTGLALGIMVIQRDLGTATIFLSIYACIVYLALRNRWILLLGIVSILISGLLGYFLFDVVRLRVDAWINPWNDPSGRSYQIVQALIAAANGGTLGRGPGMGSPGLVPIAHSDFIFSTIAEEYGLLGGVGLLVLIALFTHRGMLTALKSHDLFHRLAAGGLIAFLAGQSVLIVGGNLRVLPLTGVTLPFVSYGGSSLLTSYLSLLIVLVVSNQQDDSTLRKTFIRPIRELHLFLITGLAVTAVGLGWWSTIRGPDLLTRTDNTRRTITDRFVKRGTIYDRHGEPLVVTSGEPSGYNRKNLYPDLSPVVGYTHPVYGQSGLEATLDPWLRGMQGYPDLILLWEQIVYGQTPPGIDVRLTIDLKFQQQADTLLKEHGIGAIVMMDVLNGDLLVISTYPTFDSNNLDNEWDTLTQNPSAPFLNRAAMGQYPSGAVLTPLLLAEIFQQNIIPVPAKVLSYDTEAGALNCVAPISHEDSVRWEKQAVSACPGFALSLGQQLNPTGIYLLMDKLGFYDNPELYLPSSPPPLTIRGELPIEAVLGFNPSIRLNLLQLITASAALSGNGTIPAPHLLSAVKDPQTDWEFQPSPNQPATVFSHSAVDNVIDVFRDTELPIWQFTAFALEEGANPPQPFTWYIGGTQPEWPGSPLAIVVLLESENPLAAEQIGKTLFRKALEP